MSSIGTVLKEARGKKSVSLEDVHVKTKIHPRVLQLLEEDKFEKLPSPIFVKSFLKIYADFLEINSEELVTVYEKEKRKDPDQVLYIKPADPYAGRQGIHPFYYVAGACLALLLVLVLAGQPTKILREWKAGPKTVKVSSPPAPVAKKTPVKSLPIQTPTLKKRH